MTGASLQRAEVVASGGSPFALDDEGAYRAWRERKLAVYPRSVEELFVDIADPAALTTFEHAAIRERCARANMAIYILAGTPRDEKAQRAAVLALGPQLGLTAVEDHRSRDNDGLVAIEVVETGGRLGYIPYTSRPIAWHTDGYYNFHGPERAVQAMLLHCMRDADGGDNRLLDHEIAYIRLRDEDPAHIAALMHPEAMSIPENVEPDGKVRPVNVGPVFYIDPRTGALGMRYTARTRSIAWREDAATQRAVAALSRILVDETLTLSTRMRPGMGLVCNNVLHDRTGFAEGSGGGRLVYRIRYHGLIA
ncbi:MAG: TauD/TfdA family dioxygenase [Rhodoblastus sp.]|nr:TauD/TfdA family dioxygenase [Rhodoblastus sp.]